MRAIETQYKGRNFRSRTEARWAVYLDAMGIRWEYELEGYEFRDGTRYLCDFWLPEWGLWLEIKGEKPTDEEMEKTRLLAFEGDTATILYWGQPRIAPPQDIGVCFAWDYKGFTEAEPCGIFVEAANGLALDSPYSRPRRVGYFGPELPVVWKGNPLAAKAYDRSRQACTAAVSARFEFGETPV